MLCLWGKALGFTVVIFHTKFFLIPYWVFHVSISLNSLCGWPYWHKILSFSIFILLISFDMHSSNSVFQWIFALSKGEHASLICSCLEWKCIKHFTYKLVCCRYQEMEVPFQSQFVKSHSHAELISEAIPTSIDMLQCFPLICYCGELYLSSFLVWIMFSFFSHNLFM